jgi:hypothetical protein
MNRWLWITIVALSFGLTAGCTKEEKEATNRAVQGAQEVKKEADGPISWVASQIEREQKEKADQQARLQKIIDDVERLLSEGKLDDAEVKAVNIAWKPITSAENSTDKLLVAQFDEKRRTLLSIIERRRNAR